MNYNLENLGEYAMYFSIFLESINDILKGYADSMMQKLPIGEDGTPDYEAVAAHAKNLKTATDKAKTILDYYYAAYLTMANNIDDIPVVPVEHMEEELADEGANES